MKTCVECDRDFVPSSRHRKCPSCRKTSMSKVCPCGSIMHKNAKLCKKCVDRKGTSNSNWRGGKTYHKKGYVMCRVDGEYIFEHILVMEEKIGRKLLPGENVHHINGIKDDNRPENLELWCRPQPAGIRAEDAYAHALEIVERYSVMFEGTPHRRKDG